MNKSPIQGETAALLETHALSRHFGGLKAVDSVDFTINSGEIRALIGSNGAGKSTLVAMLCGRLLPTAGRVHFEGVDITRFSPDKRIALGMGYTFQITRVFGELTVLDNVILGARQQGKRNIDGQDADSINRSVNAKPAVRAANALARFGLDQHARRLAKELSYGHRRLLEVVMATATHPRLLMLDEPTQGLADAEIENFNAVIRDISQHSTVLLIEHNMHVVMELATRISVMHEGRMLAEGEPDEIRANPEVQAAYLE
ncbi:MAG: ABC transporter ATP-binding protein [Granulosicoccus sp.]